MSKRITTEDFINKSILIHGNIYDLENNLLRNLTKYNYIPKLNFAGKTECFSELQPILKCLAKYLNDEGGK